MLLKCGPIWYDIAYITTVNKEEHESQFVLLRLRIPRAHGWAKGCLLWGYYITTCIIYIYMCIYVKWIVFVNVATKSAQHVHARRITTVVEKVTMIWYGSGLFQQHIQHWNSSAQSTKWSSYGNRHIWGSRPHPAWFICSIWYYRPYYIAATTAWVGNQRCCIKLVQILFEPAETIRCYQWHKIIISKSVFRSASGISAWSNNLHPVYNTAGRNSTEISAKFPSLCWWHTAVHGLQAKQSGIITPNHQ